jgi:hypothetical protein
MRYLISKEHDAWQQNEIHTAKEYQHKQIEFITHLEWIITMVEEVSTMNNDGTENTYYACVKYTTARTLEEDFKYLQTVYPAPNVASDTNSLSVGMNEEFSIQFSLTNAGGTSSTDTYLSISMSDNLDFVSAEINPASPDWITKPYTAGEDPIFDYTGNQILAINDLIEFYSHPLDWGETVDITVTLRSNNVESTSEWIKYRAAMLPEDVTYPTSVPTARDPSDGDIDQQGWPIHKIDISVIGGSTGDPDFTVTANPASLTYEIPESGTTAQASIITVSSVNGWIGIVDLSGSWINEPYDISYTVDPVRIVLSSDGSSESALTIMVGSGAYVGAYTLRITGTSGSDLRTVDITILVNPRP